VRSARTHAANLKLGQGISGFPEGVDSDVGIAVGDGGALMADQCHHDGVWDAGVFEEGDGGMAEAVEGEFLSGAFG
jgi:hypothetical protein